MPDYPVVSRTEPVRALQWLGFVQVRQRGSQVVLRRGKRGDVVPLHRELKRSTMGAIIRQAGIESDQVIVAL